MNRDGKWNRAQGDQKVLVIGKKRIVDRLRRWYDGHGIRQILHGRSLAGRMLQFSQCMELRHPFMESHGKMHSGWRFDDKALQEYFDFCSWYMETITPEDFDDSVLNQYKTANRDLIVEYEQEKSYR